MTPARFGFQALLVLALVALVSWPDHRQLRAGAFWHRDRPVLNRAGEAGERAGRATAREYQIGHGSASEAVLGADGALALHRKLYDQDIEGSRRRMPPLVRLLGGKLNAIVGSARTSVDLPMAFARLLLRNLTTGAIEARATADEDGRFSFLDVIPGRYIVELQDANGGVIAASGPLVIGVNDVRETIVRASGRRTLTSSGGALAPSAPAAVAAAVGDGTNRIAAPERCASPPCPGATQ